MSATEGPPAPKILARAGRWSLRLLLALATLAVLASPFGVAFYISYRDRWIGPQLDTLPPRLPAFEMSDFRSAGIRAAAGGPSEPVLLAYHDITWNSISRYTVTPAAFGAQMAMLRAAGYRTLTAAQLVRYLRGGSVPPRSVAVTFDDGARGLWTYADRILQRYHFHALAFLITGRVGTHQPYYLTWQEIRRMYASGRWDFESHTNALHEMVRVSAAETMPEFRVRVRDDLLKSIAEIRARQMPRPELFAYPFSENFGAPPFTASAFANRLIHRLFAGAMTNYVDPAVPLSRREAASGFISRLEVTRPDTAASLFRRMAAMANIPVARVAGFRYQRRWQGEGDRGPGIRADRKTITFRDNKLRWAFAAYAPGATADWDGYAITADIGGLDYRSNPTATLSVRFGAASQLNLSVANHYVSVTVGSVQSSVQVLARDLPSASAHVVSIRVRRTSTEIFIDGTRVLRRRVVPGPASTGGFAVSSFRPDRKAPFPVFGHLRCRRLEP